MSKITTIIFDAGGIVIYIEKTRNEIIKTVLRSMGYSDALVKSGLATLKQYDKDYFKAGNNIRNWGDEKAWLMGRYEKLASIIDYQNTELADKLYLLTFDTHVYKLYPEAIEVLETLKKMYRISMISNAFPSLDWCFDQLDIRKYFEDIVISSYEGITKPNPQIYKVAIKRLGVCMDECIYIDDRVENVEAAIALGMKGYHLNRDNNNLRDFATYISRLDEGNSSQ
jgi:epoxide hydrolase-like predicted phosphatase